MGRVVMEVTVSALQLVICVQVPLTVFVFLIMKPLCAEDEPCVPRRSPLTGAHGWTRSRPVTSSFALNGPCARACMLLE